MPGGNFKQIKRKEVYPARALILTGSLLLMPLPAILDASTLPFSINNNCSRGDDIDILLLPSSQAITALCCILNPQ